MSAAGSVERPPKRRLVLTQPTKPIAGPSLPIKPTVSLSETVNFSFEGVPSVGVHVVNTNEELVALLTKHVDTARGTHTRWARSPHAAWVQTLLGELTPEQRSELQAKQQKLRRLQADDFLTRWTLASEFAADIVNAWLSERTLADVLAKSASFGHGELEGGVVLAGALVREMAAAEEVSVGTLMPWVRVLTQPEAGTTSTDATATASTAATAATTAATAAAAAATTASTACASVYRVAADNHFQSSPDTRAPLEQLEAELHERLASGVGGAGSLNTTFDYGSGESPSSRVPLLDSYWHQLDEILYGMDDATLRTNERLYLIWKLAGYCTPYHQDIHVPPHLTLYNQVSGVSTFHFLPLLVGLYASHVGRQQGAAALATLLAALRERGVGQVATIGPRQMLLILPWSAHGVYVPRVAAPPPAAAAPSDAPPPASACAPTAANANANANANASTVPPPSAAAAAVSAAAAAASAAAAAAANAALPRFDLSVIRAAECFVWPLYEANVRRLMASTAADASWCDFVPLSREQREAEAHLLERFAAQQQTVLEALELTRSEWLFLASRLQERWEAEEEEPTATSE